MINKIVNIFKTAFPDLVLRDGKPIKDWLIKPSAAINEFFETEKINLLEKLYIGNYSNMTFNELDLLVSNYLNTQRKLGRYSSVTVRIYMSQRTDVVFDQNKASFQDIRGKNFIPRFDFAITSDNLKYDSTLSKYYIDIPLISQEPFGEEYYIKAGDINTYLGSNDFIDSVSNLNDSILVDVQESNTELYNRITENGVIINSSRNNYFANLVYQTFADIKKFMVIGSGNDLMIRDLTFNSIDANITIAEYNFYKKKTGSVIDNPNRLYKGLLDNITIDKIESPALMLAIENLNEVSQENYESIAYRDKNSANISSLLSQDLFALYSGISDLTQAGWFVGENGSSWNKGSSAIEFTNNFSSGIGIKGKYITEPLLANLDTGLVLYKEIDDVKNTEYLLEFIIEDFETTITSSTLRETTGTTKKIISNNNPFYFSVLKRGINDVSNIKCSTYDGYGVVIKRSITTNEPNVFIVDGSSATGDVAFEQEILSLGSERVLAGGFIPINSNVKYTCILQINEGYGLKAIFKNEYNAEIGQLIVGSGSIDSDYTTTYTTETDFEEKQKNSYSAALTDNPRKFKFISSTNEDEYCASFLDLSFTVSKSDDAISKIFKISPKIVSIDINSTPLSFNDFRTTIVGDIIEINNANYIITSVYNSYQIEVDRELPDLNVLGESWIVWRSLTYNIDYDLPNKPFLNSLIVSRKGVEKIGLNTDDKLNQTQLKFLFIQKNGIDKKILIDWISLDGVSMIPYEAQNNPFPSRLKNVLMFDEVLSSNYYFTNSVNNENYQAIYLTQIGYDNISSNYFRVQLNSELPYILEKNNFKQGYYLPVPYSSGYTKITYIDELKIKSSGFAFTKNTHYEVLNDVITDILINPVYFQLFNNDLDIEAEIIGPGANAEISTIASSKGNTKIYLTTGAINNINYFSVIVNNERYFIKSVDLNSINSPYSDKKIELILDRVIPLFENITVKLRKKTTITGDSNNLRFGYRYDIANDRTNEELWKDTDTLVVNTSSKALVKGEDFDDDKNIQIERYFISDDIYNTVGFDNTDKFTFIFDYRSILEERKSDGFSKFKPISNGSYLGLGFKSVNNGSWKLINLKIRKLLEKHSVFIAEMNVGNKPVSNEDRIKINLNTYSINTNSSSLPLNGSRLFIYNNSSNNWETLYENNATTSDNASVILQYYDGINKETRQFDFGYWDGSNFISINSNFYPTNYVNKSGNMYLLIASRGKNEKSFNSNLVFGEAKLFLDYLNIIWQRKLGVHLGNKIDIWTASSSTYKTKKLLYQLTSATNKIIIDDSFTRPLIRINSITAENSSIPLGFELINNDQSLRFSNKEDLEIIFSNILSSGNYEISYDYFPHISEKQFFVDSLENHVDCLIKQFVPCFIKINLGYYGTIDITKTKNEIYQYLRFSSNVDIDYIKAIIENNGAVLVTLVGNDPFASIEEYDLLTEPITKTLYSFYSLKPEKYFELKKEDINLIKLK